MREEVKLKKKTEEAESRSYVYGLLSLVYREEPTTEFLKQIRSPEFVSALNDLGIELGEGFWTRHGEQLLEELVLEYTRLFIGPGRHISPYESVHREEEGLLWGSSTVRVKTFIESSGLKYRSDFKGIPDHISVELEFMQKLTRYEAEAWEQQDHNKAIRSLELEKRFIKEHLLQWIPKFSELVIQEARLVFYREMAKLTKEYIIFEAKKL